MPTAARTTPRPELARVTVGPCCCGYSVCSYMGHVALCKLESLHSVEPVSQAPSTFAQKPD